MTPKTFVPPEGDLINAKYIIIGEQPGYKEVRFHRPFIGPAGKELSDDLKAVGINRRSLGTPLKSVKSAFRPVSGLQAR